MEEETQKVAQTNGQEEQQPVEQTPKTSDDQQQKRGQFEFVEFVEPHAKALKNVEYLDKRAPVSEFRSGSDNYFYYGSNNVLFIGNFNSSKHACRIWI